MFERFNKISSCGRHLPKHDSREHRQEGNVFWGEKFDRSGNSMLLIREVSMTMIAEGNRFSAEPEEERGEGVTNAARMKELTPKRSSKTQPTGGGQEKK